MENNIIIRDNMGLGGGKERHAASSCGLGKRNVAALRYTGVGNALQVQILPQALYIKKLLKEA